MIPHSEEECTLDKPIFEVEIRNGTPKGYETSTVLKMPATWSEFQDALQKARIEEGCPSMNEPLQVRYGALNQYMVGRNVDLYDLNLLAHRLAALPAEQASRMNALLALEWSRHRGPVPLKRLLDMSYNTDACCIAPRVSNRQELGAFLYENDMLSAEAAALVDTTEPESDFRAELLKLLAGQHLKDHEGAFTSYGYVELVGEIRPRPADRTCFQRPGAPVVLEVTSINSAATSPENNRAAVLNLPAEDESVRQAVEAAGVDSVEDCAFHCIDCRIPSLRGSIGSAIAEEGGLEQVQAFARALARKEQFWNAEEFVKYKALLEASGRPSLRDAVQLMEETEQYELRSEVAAPWDYAEMAAMEKYPDLPPLLFQATQAEAAGRAMLEADNGAITGYGLIRRTDGQPLPVFTGDPQREEFAGPQMTGM